MSSEASSFRATAGLRPRPRRDGREYQPHLPSAVAVAPMQVCGAGHCSFFAQRRGPTLQVF